MKKWPEFGVAGSLLNIYSPYWTFCDTKIVFMHLIVYVFTVKDKFWPLVLTLMLKICALKKVLRSGIVAALLPQSSADEETDTTRCLRFFKNKPQG